MKLKTPAWLHHPLVLAAARLIVGGIYIYASLDKIARPELFSKAVFAYKILPMPLVNLFALALPWCELAGGLLLLAGIWPRAAALLLSGLTGMFLVAIPLVLLRGLKIDCGCFGADGGAAVGWGLWLRDLALLAGALVVALPAAGERTGLARRLPFLAG